MECFLQYLDDLDDIVYSILLIGEKIRRACRMIFFVMTSILLQALGVFLALTNPPLAVATASLLLVTLLYRGAVHHGPRAAATA